MAISPVNANAPVPPVQKIGTDADGDTDGTKATSSPTPVAPISKPTETMGNNINVYA